MALGRGGRHIFDDWAYFHPTATSVVPILLEHMLRRNLINPELSAILVGAGECPAERLEEVRDRGIRVAFGYVLTETSSGVAISAEGEDPYALEVCKGSTVTLAEDGERKFTFARKPGADMLLSEDDVKEDDIAGSAIVHAGSCSLSAQPEADATVKALRLGNERGRLVSFDVNYRNLMWNDDVAACTKAVKDILKYVDLLKISEEEVEMMGGEASIPALMAENGVALVVQTLGSKGARAYFKGTSFDVPGRRAKAVDATGAGDAFWGAFLSKLRILGVESAADLTEEIIREALDYGNVSGCICVQQKGAIASIPTRAQIEAYLESGK